MTEEFSQDVKIKCLLWSDRHCCLCGKACGTNIVIAHIIPKAKEGTNNIDNAIPLCFDCHSEIGRYNEEHPKGNKYKPKELKARRKQIYDKYTCHLVPPIDFQVTQKSHKLPKVGFTIRHLGDSLPVRVLVVVEIFLEDISLGMPRGEYYTGKKVWHMNPGSGIRGVHFEVPEEVVNSDKRLMVTVNITIIDRYEREHNLLPVGWVYMREKNSWYAEP